MAHALLIDGENLSSAHAGRLLDAVPADCAIRRVYGDPGRLNGWMAVAGLHVIGTQPGKNAADIRLAIDATALAVAGSLTGVTLATSDSGLTALVFFLRERGLPVTLACAAQAPAMLRGAACNVIDLDPAPAVPTTPKPAPLSDLDRLIVDRVAAEGAAGLAVARLNVLAQKNSGIRISTLPEKTWRAYLTARPQLYRCDPRGPDARVRLAAPA